MTTEVDICNLALSAMGTRSQINPGSEENIAEVTEDSPEADHCKLWYPRVRDTLLRRSYWNFARTFSTLTLVRELPESPASYVWNFDRPAPPYRYEYAHDEDEVARVRYIWPAGTPIPPSSFDQYYTETNVPVKFEIINHDNTKLIATNQEDAMMVYTKKVTDPDQWDSDFMMAVISELAARLAIPLSGDKDLMRLNKQAAVMDLDTARLTDALEGGPHEQVHPIPDWISARD